jgi:hypothetical protein
MKSIKTAFILLLLIILSGCISEKVKPPVPSSTPSVITPLPTKTYIPNTPTVTKTATLPPTSTHTSTATLTMTPTETPQPTLLPEERNTLIRELLATNGGCRLPCWWGIVPGKTPWPEAEQLFSHLRLYITDYLISENSTDHELGTFDPSHPEIEITHSYIERDGLVYFMKIIARGLIDNAYFKKTWKNLSPENIVSLYGTPSRVWLWSIAYFPESPAGTEMQYQVWLFYDELGFLAAYTGLVPYKPTYHICPTFGGVGQIYELELYIKPPASTAPLETLTRFPSQKKGGF